MFTHIYIKDRKSDKSWEGQVFNTLTKIFYCIVIPLKKLAQKFDYITLSLIMGWSKLQIQCIPPLSKLYIANLKYLEYYREEECHVMFKNIKCILKMTRWHAIHSTFSFFIWILYLILRRMPIHTIKVFFLYFQF